MDWSNDGLHKHNVWRSFESEFSDKHRLVPETQKSQEAFDSLLHTGNNILW